jgi:hypothetical protein
VLLALAVSVVLVPPVQPCQHEPSMRASYLAVAVAQSIGAPLAALQLSRARPLRRCDFQRNQCAAQAGHQTRDSTDHCHYICGIHGTIVDAGGRCRLLDSPGSGPRRRLVRPPCLPFLTRAARSSGSATRATRTGTYCRLDGHQPQEGIAHRASAPHDAETLGMRPPFQAGDQHSASRRTAFRVTMPRRETGHRQSPPRRRARGEGCAWPDLRQGRWRTARPASTPDALTGMRGGDVLTPAPRSRPPGCRCAVPG